MEKEILTAPEVAKIFGVTSAAINRWCKDRDFPNSYKLNPHKRKSPWRIPRSDVDLFKQKRREQYGFIRLPVAPKEPDESADGSQRDAAQLMLINEL